jgi:hypothetical protein
MRGYVLGARLLLRLGLVVSVVDDDPQPSRNMRIASLNSASEKVFLLGMC